MRAFPVPCFPPALAMKQVTRRSFQKYVNAQNKYERINTSKLLWSLRRQKFCGAQIECEELLQCFSLFQKMLLVFDLRPLIGIARRRLSLDDRLPLARQLAIERDE